MKSKRLFIAASIIATLVAAGVPHHAGAAGTPVIVSGPGDWLTTYKQPVVVVGKGDQPIFYNFDAQQHDVVADTIVGGITHRRDAESALWCSGFQRSRCPLFWSALIPIGQNTPVLGLEDAVPGRTYDFTCTIHPNMFGKLVVLPE